MVRRTQRFVVVGEFPAVEIKGHEDGKAVREGAPRVRLIIWTAERHSDTRNRSIKMILKKMLTTTRATLSLGSLHLKTSHQLPM